MQPHQERVVTEKTELDGKLDKLNLFFTTKIYADLPEDEQRRLDRQATIMTRYSEVLGERIAAFPSVA